jgi:hypothetical protein
LRAQQQGVIVRASETLIGVPAVQCSMHREDSDAPSRVAAAAQTSALVPSADRARLAAYLGVCASQTGGAVGPARALTVARVSPLCDAASTRYASLADFSRSDVRRVSHFAHVPSWQQYTPYCVDFPRRALVYVHARDRDLFAHPFLYMRQRATAQAVASVPFARLAELTPSTTAHAPSPWLIVSPGRCGSTLLVRLLRAAGVPAVSEPDVFTSYATWRMFDEQADDRDAPAALRACVEHFRTRLGAPPVLKLRGVCCFESEAILRALPQARCIFLLREPYSWARSQGRAFGFQARAMALVMRAALVAFERARRAGRRPILCWYEELMTSPGAVIRRITGGDAALGEAAVRELVRRDAQQGTVLARATLAERAVDAADLDAFAQEWKRVMHEGQSERTKATTAP